MGFRRKKKTRSKNRIALRTMEKAFLLLLIGSLGQIKIAIKSENY